MTRQNLFRAITIGFVLGALMCLCVVAFGEEPQKLEIQYTRFGNHPVELVVNNGYVMLRIAVPKHEGEESDPVLEFLKNEVLHLTSSHNPVQLGSTGLSFQFEGGYPIWSPGCSECGSSRELLFAHGARVDNRMIRAKGTEKRIGFDGYAVGWTRE